MWVHDANAESVRNWSTGIADRSRSDLERILHRVTTSADASRSSIGGHPAGDRLGDQLAEGVSLLSRALDELKRAQSALSRISVYREMPDEQGDPTYAR